VIAIIFALVSYLGWGVGDIFGTIVTRKIGAFSTTFWSLLFSFIFASLYIPFALVSLHSLSVHLLFLNLFLGVLFLLGITAFNEALKVGNASLVGTIAASFSVLVVIFSVLFLRESLSMLQIIPIIIIFAGLILSTLNIKEFRKGIKINDRAIKLAIFTMFSWGIYFTFIKIPIKQIGWFWPNYITLCLFPLVYLCIKLQKIELKKPNVKGALLSLFAMVFLSVIANFSFNISLSKGFTSVVTPIAGSYPTLFVILAFLVFRDPIKRHQIFGILTTLVGIILLAFFSR